MKTVFLIVALGLLGLLGYLFYYDATQPSVIQLNSVDSSSTITNNEAPTKTGEEVRAELIKEGSEHVTALIKDARAEKRQKDSIHLANRQAITIFQIGGFKSDAQDFEELYKRLTEAGITNIYIMRQSRKVFYLLKNDNTKSMEEVGDKLSSFHDAMKKADIREDIEVKDLHSFCDSEDALPDGDVKVARKVRVECYICK